MMSAKGVDVSVRTHELLFFIAALPQQSAVKARNMRI
jgi:hypothetical protein